MPLARPVTWSESHGLHAPKRAVWVGVPIDGDELPERAERIRSAFDAGRSALREEMDRGGTSG